MIGPEELDRALGRVRAAVWLLLATCALVAALGRLPEPGPQAEARRRTATYGALALASVAIFARRGATRARSPARRARLALAGLVAAGGLGLLGVALALAAGDRRAALLLVAAGGIFSLPAPGAGRRGGRDGPAGPLSGR